MDDFLSRMLGLFLLEAIARAEGFYFYFQMTKQGEGKSSRG